MQHLQWDEKRQQPWQDFLRTKATSVEYAEREARILRWFDLHRRQAMVASADVVRVRGELDEIIEQFSAKCNELKKVGHDSARHPA